MTRDKPARSRGVIGGAIGGSLIAAACVPKVSATIVIDEPRPTPDRPNADPDRPKPPPGPDLMPPEIVRAELIGGTKVRIHFSEAIAPVVGIDPRDFRISFMRRYVGYGGPYAYAYYYDPGYLNYGNPLVNSSVSSEDADQLELGFAPEISSGFCRGLEYGYAYVQGSDAGLFLHYAAGKIPVRDTDGNQMSSFGTQWVALGRDQPPQNQLMLSGKAAREAGRGLVRIACGPPLPPGPR